MTHAAKASLAALSAMRKEEFTSQLGGLFEHSPWVAESAWTARPFASIDALHRAMMAGLNRATDERKLSLIRAHPELAGREAAAGSLTNESKGEQSSAGLDRCTPGELQQLHEGNRRYREKFGFPFVMAVKGSSRRDILDALAARLRNSRDAEFETALEQIGKIARLRLEALIEDD